MKLTDAPIFRMDYNEISRIIRDQEIEIKRLQERLDEDKCSVCLYGHGGSPLCKECKHNRKFKDYFARV